MALSWSPPESGSRFLLSFRSVEAYSSCCSPQSPVRWAERWRDLPEKANPFPQGLRVDLSVRWPLRVGVWGL